MKGKKKVKEPAGMNIPEIFAALAMLEKERGIPQTFMMDKIIQAVTTAYKRDHKDVENVIVDVDEEHQRLKMYVQKNVVAEEDYVDPFNEIPVEEAKTISARYEIGDVVNIPVDNTEFGRIAAGNGKQVIIQGLREAERGMVYDEFNSKQHEILTGVVTRIDPRTNAVSLRIGTGTESTEALLLSGEQVPGEELVEGQHVKVYVVDVRRSTRSRLFLSFISRQPTHCRWGIFFTFCIQTALPYTWRGGPRRALSPSVSSAAPQVQHCDTRSHAAEKETQLCHWTGSSSTISLSSSP